MSNVVLLVGAKVVDHHRDLQGFKQVLGELRLGGCKRANAVDPNLDIRITLPGPGPEDVFHCFDSLGKVAVLISLRRQQVQ